MLIGLVDAEDRSAASGLDELDADSVVGLVWRGALVADRHDALRTVYPDGLDGRPVGVVLRHVAVPFTTSDGDPDTVADAERTRVFDVATGPLLRAVLVRRADDRSPEIELPQRFEVIDDGRVRVEVDHPVKVRQQTGDEEAEEATTAEAAEDGTREVSDWWRWTRHRSDRRRDVEDGPRRTNGGWTARQ